MPSYLGSSFAFIGPVLAATGAAVAAGPNPNIGLALGGIIAAGALYSIIGLIVMAAGHAWVEKLMPPVVTGGDRCGDRPGAGADRDFNRVRASARAAPTVRPLRAGSR